MNSPGARFNRYRLLHGQECPEDDTLFAGKVRFVGDRVAAVVADSPRAAEAAAALIAVEYEELPAMTTPEEALRDERRPDPRGRQPAARIRRQTGRGASLLKTETSSWRPSPGRRGSTTPPWSPTPAWPNSTASGKLTVWSPSQGAYGVRTVLADLFHLSYNKVRVIKVPVGGSFGGKQEFILEPVAAWLAIATRRPVKLLFDREECIVATTTRPATASKIGTVVARDGRLKQFTVDTTFDAGAYATSSIDMAHAMAKKITRLYRLPYYRHRCRVAYTNTPIAGGVRGWGGPEITVAAEIHLDQVARRLGIDPLDLRLRNLVHPHDTDPATGLSAGRRQDYRVPVPGGGSL